MASIAGRPYNVGFTFRVISAQSGLTQEVLNVIEYNFNSGTLALERQVQLLSTVPYTLTKGSFLEFTAGLNRDQFTVVFVNCSRRCEVLTVSIINNVYYILRLLDLLRNCE